MRGSSALNGSWNTIWIAALRLAAAPPRPSSDHGTAACPRSVRCNPATTLPSVLLPLPLSPTSASTSPSAIVKLTSTTACTDAPLAAKQSAAAEHAQPDADVRSTPSSSVPSSSVPSSSSHCPGLEARGEMSRFASSSSSGSDDPARRHRPRMHRSANRQPPKRAHEIRHAARNDRQTDRRDDAPGSGSVAISPCGVGMQRLRRTAPPLG